MEAGMGSFVGRAKELDALERACASKKTEFLPVYGRRRVGKSELLLHFLDGKPGLYFLGKKATPQLQIEEFMEIAAASLDQPLLAEAAVSDWRRAFDLVLEHKPRTRKFILVMDEFQWTAKASPELPSLLQGICDTNARGDNDLMLILCGSYMGFMEREVLGEKSPLYGRRTGQIFLQPFSYREAAGFHPGLSEADLAVLHFLCGGIPFYLRFFDQKKSVAMNIRDNFLNEFAALYREADFLLREELKELSKPHLTSYWGRCFETLCRDALPALYEAEGIGSAFEIGEYWDKNVQIDVVGLRADNSTDLCECKWGAIRSATALGKELERKKTLYPNRRNATVRLRAFAQKPPRGASRSASITWHSLTELYAL